MQPRTTVWLALVALALGAFIYLFEVRGGDERARAEALEKRLFAGLEVARIERLELSTADGQAAVIERDGDRWMLVEPLSAPASPAAVKAILDALEGLEREGGVDAPDDLAPFELAEGAHRVGFSGEGVTGELLLGRATPVGANRYVIVPGASRIDLVRSFRLNAFEAPLDDLRDKRVLPLEIAAVKRLTARWPGQSVELERRDDGWWMTAPLESRADTSSVDTLLADVAFLSAEGFVDAASAADRRAVAGLAEPAFALRVEGMRDAASSDAPTGQAPDAVGETAPGSTSPSAFALELTVGPVLERDAGLRVAKGRDGMLFAIAAERLDDWPREVVAYRDKTLSQFDVSEARTFELAFAADESPTPEAAPAGQRDQPAGERDQAAGERDQAAGGGDEAAGAADGAPLRIQAELAGAQWRSAPEAMAPSRAAALIAELAHLEGIDIVAERLGDAERAALGLRPPRVSIRVWGDGDSGASAPLLAELSLGHAHAGRGVFAKRRDSDVVYVLDPALAAEIPLSVESFRSDFVEAPDAPAADGSEEHEPGPADDVPEI